ncbi:sialidase family protein [Gracilibacillus phocaeensis]|uniref:sialidase family protein n=1 Tax=Gracilibacillus phocaeensis TaxID=2042304 RepID=UPI00102F7BE8|nr:sialidase family protein [Gracilibacillus phocaeensis]
MENKNLITLPDIKMDGNLYKNERLNIVESLLPSSFDSNHACDLLELSNGDLLCAWFAGSDEGNADISIVLSRLNKGENQWSDPVIISDNNGYSEQNPSLFLHPNGEIWAMYTAQVSKESAEGVRFNLQYTSKIYRKISTDNGYTWGSAEVMFDREGSFCRQKIQVLANGRWLFENWICFDDDSHNGSDITIVNISDDEGKSWKAVKIPNSRGRVHCNVLEVEKGHVIGLFRSRAADNIYFAQSFDNGDTWTEPIRTELPNNNSSISAIKLQSGNLALIYNHLRFNDLQDITVWPFERCPVTVAISEDNGRSWPYRRHIEIGEGYCGNKNRSQNRRYEYPCIMQDKNGLIHAAYSFGNRETMKHIVFTENWVTGEEQGVK